MFESVSSERLAVSSAERIFGSGDCLVRPLRRERSTGFIEAISLNQPRPQSPPNVFARKPACFLGREWRLRLMVGASQFLR
jgi:hypothetical protein